MRFRTSTVALVGAGALSAVLIAAAPSSAAPYPPSGCGTSGTGTVSRTEVRVGEAFTFSGAGFAAASTETITVDGARYGTAPANAGGTFTITIRITVPGVHTLRGIGPIGNTVTCGAGAAATSHGSVVPALARTATVVPAADVVNGRTVTATVTVLAAGASGGSGSGTVQGSSNSSSTSGGLPFTGAETAGLVAAAVLLIAGGIVLRVGVRRRRTSF